MPDNQMLITVAHSINNALQPAEASAKAAAVASAELVLTMLRQHGEAGLHDAIGLTAIGHAARASALAVEAREAQIRAHGALNRDLKTLGLERMYGKYDELPVEDDDEKRRQAGIYSGVLVAQPQPA